MTDTKREELFEIFHGIHSQEEREIAAEQWLSEISFEGIGGDFAKKCAPFFANAAYLCRTSGAADVIAYGIRGAYLAGVMAN